MAARSRLCTRINGSALAIPRVLAAILENNLEADGRVRVPAVLHHWYGGDYIGQNRT